MWLHRDQGIVDVYLTGIRHLGEQRVINSVVLFGQIVAEKRLRKISL